MKIKGEWEEGEEEEEGIALCPQRITSNDL